MNDKIIFIPYDKGYHIHCQEFGGDEKYLGKIRQDLLDTAIWFYTQEDNLSVIIIDKETQRQLVIK